MAWVRMLVGISGGRHDGRAWPPAGGVIEMPDWEAGHLIAGGNAKPHDGPEPGAEREPLLPPPPERDPAPGVVSVAPPEVSPLAEVSPVAGTSGTEMTRDPEDEHDRLEAVADGDLEPEPATVVPEPDAAPPAPEEVPPEESARPAPSAPKQAWIDYAVAQGADVHAASAMTKVDLMSRYGGRL